MKINTFIRAIAAMFSPTANATLAVNAVTFNPPAEGVINLLPTAAHAANVLVKWGADETKYAVCTASTDFPLGIVTSAVASTELTRNQAVYLLGAWRKPELVNCSEAIAITDELYPAASGGVQNKPTASGTHYRIGRPLYPGVSGSPVAAQHCYPQAVVVP
jgi:hypothetical protein